MTRLKVLVAGHDWGGLAALAPLMSAWLSDVRLELRFLSAPAARRDMKERLPGLDMAIAADRLTEAGSTRSGELCRIVDEALDAGRYDAVVCSTSAQASIERCVLRAARRRAIPSVAICDMWYAYGLRFQDADGWALPDRLWVLDERMRREAEAELPPNGTAIEVIGSPVFSDILYRRKARNGAARAVRFVSEPVSAAFPEAGVDEFEVAEQVLRSLRELDADLPLVVRPHPAESVECWRRWVHHRRAQRVEMETLPAREAIGDTRMAVGISSTLLAEMSLYGVPAAAFMVAGSDDGYYCLPFDELRIAKVRCSSDLLRWMAAPGEGAPPDAAAFHADAVLRASQSLLRMVEAAR